MSAGIDSGRLRAALKKTTDALLAELNPKGFWAGELSSSALSTAVALIALQEMGDSTLIPSGLKWLADNINADGGWGDTIRSKSNLSTTALVWAAFGATRTDKQFSAVVQRAESWMWKEAGSKENLAAAIVAGYGKDRTFSVPILMTLALSGRLGERGWRSVMPLPFELAIFPHSWFGALQLPVVSYALPALIAIGQTIHHHAPSRNPFARVIRNWSQEKTLRRLETLQPANGGFLEATPLTAFVTMSLASMGLQTNPVARLGADFLKKSVRVDGSWPIDTNLATWLTTLAVKALSYQTHALALEQKRAIRDWLLAQQYATAHACTGAAPGGWAWTDLPGGVPDADDTAGALVALHALDPKNSTVVEAAERGVTWLLNLQNRDGGIPTFCRGWGTLPFDRSAPELTAHAMQAWICWQPHLKQATSAGTRKGLQRAHRFLARSQRSDGAWVPLWFGNEQTEHQENPVYGTARTLIGAHASQDIVDIAPAIAAAENFLKGAQLASGGWGGDCSTTESLEETAVVVEALNDERGAIRLIELIESNAFEPAPIGLYFARLWYFERLYPLIFGTAALGSVQSKLR